MSVVSTATPIIVQVSQPSNVLQLSTQVIAATAAATAAGLSAWTVMRAERGRKVERFRDFLQPLTDHSKQYAGAVHLIDSIESGRLRDDELQTALASIQPPIQPDELAIVVRAQQPRSSESLDGFLQAYALQSRTRELPAAVVELLTRSLAQQLSFWNIPDFIDGPQMRSSASEARLFFHRIHEWLRFPVRRSRSQLLVAELGPELLRTLSIFRAFWHRVYFEQADGSLANESVVATSGIEDIGQRQLLQLLVAAERDAGQMPETQRTHSARIGQWE